MRAFRSERLAVVTGAAAAGLLALAFGACAPKTLPPPPLVSVPKFPEFVFPALPEGLAGPSISEQYRNGWTYLQGGDTHSAERTFNAVLKAVPGLYPAEAALGYSALARKDAQGAVSHFDRALSKNPAYAPALAGKGDALLSLGRTDTALEAFESAIAAQPDLAGLRNRVDVLKFRNAQQEIAAARKAADSGQLDQAKRAYERAIAASPESAFLYRELAAVERRANDLPGALEHAQTAAKLDPGDARALTLIGEIHESNRDWAKAAEAYTAAAAVEPSDDLTTRAETMRDRAAFDAMPEEYRTIETAPTITRAQLAALLAVRLDSLLRRARAANAVVVTDARGSWAAPWILAVTRAGAMDVFPNHTFLPATEVKRGDLAQAVSRVLALIAAEKPRVAARWRDTHPKFTDVGPNHLGYGAAARAVASGVMAPVEGDQFELARPVTGSEAIQAVSRLQELAKGTAK